MLKWILKKSCFESYTTTEALKLGHLSAFKPNSAKHMVQTTTDSVAWLSPVPWNIVLDDKILLWVGPAGEEGEKDRGKT